MPKSNRTLFLQLFCIQLFIYSFSNPLMALAPVSLCLEMFHPNPVRDAGEVFTRFEQLERDLETHYSEISRQFSEGTRSFSDTDEFSLLFSESQSRLDHLQTRILRGDTLYPGDFKEVLRPIQNLLSPHAPPPNILEPETHSSELDSMSDFSEIQPNHMYQVMDRQGRPFDISFTPGVLNEINSNRLAEVYRKLFLKALRKGIQPGSNESGIKLMKTFEGYRFAEIKIIGKHGDKRIYGLMDSQHIEFLFLGDESASSADVTHRKIKALVRNRLAK